MMERISLHGWHVARIARSYSTVWVTKRPKIATTAWQGYKDWRTIKIAKFPDCQNNYMDAIAPRIMTVTMTMMMWMIMLMAGKVPILPCLWMWCIIIRADLFSLTKSHNFCGPVSACPMMTLPTLERVVHHRDLLSRFLPSGKFTFFLGNGLVL